jgi:Domain of unknown function (DUF4329)
MSEVLENFIKWALARNWYNAFLNLNGLNMYEMLRGLARLPPALLDDLLRESTNFWEAVNMPRIAFAANVVKQHKIPDQIPDDLEATGQVQDAKNFLATRKRPAKGTTHVPGATRAGLPFPTADQAAFAAIDEILPTSIANNWEYAGRIYKTSDSQFAFTQAPTLGRDNDSYPGPKVDGSIGTYHTHAGGFHATDELFSPADKWKATLAKEFSYVGTPRGQILRFTPIDLLSPEEQDTFPAGRVDTLRIANVLVVGQP